MNTDDFKKIDLICTLESQTTKGQVYRRELSSGERALRAVKVGGILFVLTFFSVFVPILHFVIVPLGLLMTVFFTVNAYTEKFEIKDGEVACPNCKTALKFEGEIDPFPTSKRCSHCSFNLEFKTV